MKHYLLRGIGSYDNFTSEPITLDEAKKKLKKHITMLQKDEEVEGWCDIDQGDLYYIVRGDEFFQAFDIRLCNEGYGVKKDLREIIDLCEDVNREFERYQWTLEDGSGIYDYIYDIQKLAEKVLMMVL